jgi:hypothetical protein
MLKVAIIPLLGPRLIAAVGNKVRSIQDVYMLFLLDESRESTFKLGSRHVPAIEQ